MFDVNSIANQLAVAAIGATAVWFVTEIKQMKSDLIALNKDIDEAFKKIRDKGAKK